MEKVRVGIIGIGKMGKTHIESIKDLEEAVVVAVNDPANFRNGEAGEEIARKYNIEYERSVESLVSRKDIDAIIVASPHSFHYHHTIMAINEKKHVLVEKPMALTLQDCEEMIKKARENKVKLMIGQSHRYWKGDVVAKEIIDKGDIGKIVMCRDTLCSAGYRRYETGEKEWFYNLKIYGRGGLIAWGIHNIDRFRWWFKSEGKIVLSQSYSMRTEIEGDLPTTDLFIIFENNISAHLWYSETLPEPGWEGFSCHAQIIGEEGLLDVDPYGIVKVVRKGNKEWEIIYEMKDFAKERKETFRNEDRDFIKSIIEDKEPPVSGEDGMKAVEIVIAAYLSHDLMKPIYLPLK